MVDLNSIAHSLSRFFGRELDRIASVDDSRLLLLVVAVVLVLLTFRLLRPRFWLFFYFTFVSTLLHELMHFVMALVTNGKPRGLSLVPQQRGDGILLGQVLAGNLTWYNGTLIALAPLLLWLSGYYFFFVFVLKEDVLFLLALKVYVLASMIEGGLPSPSDFRTAAKFSVVPMGIAAAVAALTFFWNSSL